MTYSHLLPWKALDLGTPLASFKRLDAARARRFLGLVASAWTWVSAASSTATAAADEEAVAVMLRMKEENVGSFMLVQ